MATSGRPLSALATAGSAADGVELGRPQPRRAHPGLVGEPVATDQEHARVQPRQPPSRTRRCARAAL
jgi:hypothetical protein